MKLFKLQFLKHNFRLSDEDAIYMATELEKVENSKNFLSLKKQLENADTTQTKKIYSEASGRICIALQKINEEILKSLIPWRKGPLKINQFDIKTEWNCNLKWERLEKLTSKMEHKTILDIGAGSGYFSLRCLDHNPKAILAIDPYLKFFFQYCLLSNLNRLKRCHFLPLGIESIFKTQCKFDVIINMGILYHRHEPIDFLKKCRMLLEKDGIMILETLIWPEKSVGAFSPKDRYAGMRNCYFIPTIEGLKNWCLKAKFETFNIINISTTQYAEQESSEWSPGHSLRNFINEKNETRTIENYPRPQRAMIYLSTVKKS